MILGHIFYAIGLILVLILITLISRFDEFYNAREWVIKYQVVTGKKPERVNFRSESEYLNVLLISLFDLLDFIWTLVGLLSSSWFVFAFLFIWSIGTNLIKSKINLNPLSKFMSFQLVLVKFITISYLIINHFHLHLDTWKLIFN